VLVTARSLVSLVRADQARVEATTEVIHHHKELSMAAMCPIDGCKAKKGLCIHDKLMIAMGTVLVALAGAHWGLNLF
jgi:hypothetical protein